MSQFRSLYKVTIDGITHDVVTSAHDMADILPDDRRMGTMYAMVHRACVRLHVPGCPTDYDRFLDLLDGVDKPEQSTNGNGAGPDDMDPTRAALSAG